MNKSGGPIYQILKNESLPLEALLVVADDIHLEPGKARIRAQGSHGGHNGLSHISDTLRTTNYPRFRLGVGSDKGNNLVDHVLSPLDAPDEARIQSRFDHFGDALLCWAKEGFPSCQDLLAR